MSSTGPTSQPITSAAPLPSLPQGLEHTGSVPEQSDAHHEQLLQHQPEQLLHHQLSTKPHQKDVLSGLAESNTSAGNHPALLVTTAPTQQPRPCQEHKPRQHQQPSSESQQAHAIPQVSKHVVQITQHSTFEIPDAMSEHWKLLPGPCKCVAVSPSLRGLKTAQGKLEWDAILKPGRKLRLVCSVPQHVMVALEGSFFKGWHHLKDGTLLLIVSEPGTKDKIASKCKVRKVAAGIARQV